MYKRILVPLDGSEAAEAILPYTEEIGARSGSEITLASVSEITDVQLDRVYRPYLDQLVTKMERELIDWRAKEGTKIYSSFLTGKPATEIVHYAEEKDMGLIAMASRGSSSEGPWLLGNIAAKILRATSKPVLLVKKPAEQAAIQQKNIIKRVLIPLDGSKLGEGAIPYVKALAKALDIEIVLLHVVEPIITAAVAGLAGVTVPSAKEETRRLTSAIDYLNNIGNILQKEGLNVSTEGLSGSAAEQIISYAEENNIDLIAMSTHGRSGIGRWVFGSVTDKVLHAGDTPVLTVRAVKKSQD